MANLIITIDGPAASGKSTVARLLAERLGASFLDTGAMYRAVTLAAMQAGIDMSDEIELLDVLNHKKFQFAAKNDKMTASIDGVDVTDRIRSPEVTASAKYIASAPKLREKLVEMQRQFAADEEKIVTEGRDQGTVAFPNACLKFYLTATPAERAKRRAAEQGLTAKDQIEQIQREIEERDTRDQSRSVGPMKPADDAVIIDTTDLSIEEVVEEILKYAESHIYRLPKMLWPRFARLLCKIFCKTFFRLQPQDRENVPDYGPLVLICNHQSFLDPLFCGIFIKRPLYFLARDTLFRGLFGKLLVSIQTIPVKRGEADLAAMRNVIDKLKAGHGVCLFPEATRTSDGKITAFKPGFGLLCRRGNASVVPVLIDGAFEAWPRHKKLFTPGRSIAVQYGKCIPSAEVKKMDDREMAERLTEALRKMQSDCRIKQGKQPYDY
ncbi:MAG: (d)CMP kinase [Phycisphaerae bacterium]|nr:(d)CMP kinase [Phycisphaerae bacterium]MDD5380129.1 (d)CMP kinase [Phycisphaerae bacterium]